MIRLVEVHKRFSDQVVLAGVDLHVPAQGVTFVVGRSGAGKSVFLRCCVGLMRVDSGEVHVGGERVDAWPERQLTKLRCRFPYVVQGSALLDWLDLWENVSVPLARALNLPAALARERAEQALCTVGLKDFLRCFPSQVGPGLCKRTLIARALALQPRAVLYDEPTTGLDVAAARLVDEVIRNAAQQGTAALVVSHDLQSLQKTADRVALLDKGVIAFWGKSRDLLDSGLYGKCA